MSHTSQLCWTLGATMLAALRHHLLWINPCVSVPFLSLSPMIVAMQHHRSRSQITEHFNKQPNLHQRGCASLWRALTMSIPSRLMLRALWRDVTPIVSPVHRPASLQTVDDDADAGGGDSDGADVSPDAFRRNGTGSLDDDGRKQGGVGFESPGGMGVLSPTGGTFPSV